MNSGDLESGNLLINFDSAIKVIELDVEKRLLFIRKIYSVLFLQILFTTAVSSVAIFEKNTHTFIINNPWISIVSGIGMICCLIPLFCFRHLKPWNYVSFALFNVFSSIMIGTVVAFYDVKVVLYALFLTIIIFLALTLFTFQSKWDFSKMGGFLMIGTFLLLGALLLGFFLPLGLLWQKIIAAFGVLLFSLYIVYDTWSILHQRAEDEWMIACIDLYLDFVNIFLFLLSLLNNRN